MADPFLGEIRMVGFSFAPENWAKCDGALIPMSQNPALASLLGDLYGGNGQTEFGLPDLRGRVPVHRGQRYNIGERDGFEYVALSVNQMPMHAHQLTGTTDDGDNPDPTGKLAADTSAANYEVYGSSDSPQVTLCPDTVSNAGKNSGHSNIQPSIGVLFCIAIEGYYPPRR